MRRALAAVAGLTALGTGVAAAAPTGHGDHGAQGTGSPTVTMNYATFSPSHLDVLAGDMVAWHNDSVRTHTVDAADDAYTSGQLPSGDMFERRYDRPGVFSYLCHRHPGMTGEVAVHSALLDAPVGASRPGQERALKGRTSLEPGTEVVLEADTGEGFAPVDKLAVAPDRSVRAEVAPKVATIYRVVSGDEASPAVRMDVLDRKVSVRLRKHTVEATVTPVSTGTPAVLQARLPERFGWWPVARAKVDQHGHVRFKRLRRRVPLRVALTLPDGATVVATSKSVR